MLTRLAHCSLDLLTLPAEGIVGWHEDGEAHPILDFFDDGFAEAFFGDLLQHTAYSGSEVLH